MYVYLCVQADLYMSSKALYHSAGTCCSLHTVVNSVSIKSIKAPAQHLIRSDKSPLSSPALLT